MLVAAGSFNPPTFMHLRVVEAAREALTEEGFDVLGAYLTPVNDAYGKKGLAPAEDRVQMCQLAAASSPYIMVDPWEALQGEYQRTLTVLRRVEEGVNAATEPGEERVRVMLVCGADLVASFAQPGVWLPDHVHTICGDFGVVCMKRGEGDPRRLIHGSDILHQHKGNIRVVDEGIENTISATELRQRVRRGQSIRYLTPDDVARYIEERQLYRTAARGSPA